MLEEAYYFGLHPNEVTELTVAEMALFIEAQKKRRLDDQKMLARTGYSAGVLGSMSFAKRMPKFEEIFKFPDEKASKEEIERSVLEMKVAAINANRTLAEKKGGM